MLPASPPRPRTQTAIVQSSPTGERSAITTLPLAVSHSVPIPTATLPSPNHVLVRVRAVALNPTDHKMVMHFPIPGNVVGCDFCGVIEKVHDAAGTNNGVRSLPLGTRVCGGVFPYFPSPPPENDDGAAGCGSGSGPTTNINGAFAQWVVADARLLLHVPDQWDDLQGAALGGVGWGTAGMVFYDPDALNLKGVPSKPVGKVKGKSEPVLVYGGATASGTMACQLLKLSGYAPIAVTSHLPASVALAIKYGAVGVAAYTSPSCIETIRTLADRVPIRHAMDCITSAESVRICFAAMARTGGRYACLEQLNESWRTRGRAVIQAKEVMGYEGLGIRVMMPGSDRESSIGNTYSRDVNDTLLATIVSWAAEMQSALDAGLISTHPIREVAGGWEGIIKGLDELRSGTVQGQKLVVRIGSHVNDPI